MKTNINQVKESPVIFNTQEVIATLAGDKTQFRIPIINNRDTAILFGDKKWRYDGMEFKEDGCCEPDPKGEHYMEELDPSEDEVHQYTERYESVGYCPLGSVGDNLWVQEDWRVGAWREMAGLIAVDYKASPELTNTPWMQINDDDDGKKFESLWIDTTDELESKGIKTNEDGNYYWTAGQAPLDWRAADTMPRWASRLTLEITDIRIERIQDISEDYIEKNFIATNLIEATEVEGARVYKIANTKRLWSECIFNAFARYWSSLYDEGAWDRNDWVWVVEFKVVEGV